MTDADDELGVLHLVVGPSGAGKDTLIDGALATRPDIARVRRVVTRAAEAVGEDHIEADDDAFERMARDGSFLLSWRAHGLAYGLPREPAASLRRRPHHLVANVSRSVLDEARRTLAPVRVLLITAPVEVLARRLASRGRENQDEIAERLARAGLADPSGPDVWRIENGGSIEDGVAAVRAALAEPPPLSRAADVR